MSGRLSRWFWLRLLHLAPRDIVDLHGRLQAQDYRYIALREGIECALAIVSVEALAAFMDEADK